MLHNTLVADMDNFIRGAKLPKHEAALWVPKNSDNEKHMAFRPIEESELKKCKDEAFAYMKAAAVHYINLEQQKVALGGGIKLVVFSGGGDAHDKGDAAKVQGGEGAQGHGEAAAFPQSQNDWAPKFCNFCRKWGHIDQYCPEMFSEEDQPDYCDVCDKEGHIEETCWVVHPELRQEYLAQQKAKQKKLICHHCGRAGHMRRFCHLLHH
jgi:hypothetical protein